MPKWVSCELTKRQRTPRVIAVCFALMVQGARLARALPGWDAALCQGRLGAHPVVAAQGPQGLCACAWGAHYLRKPAQTKTCAAAVVALKSVGGMSWCAAAGV